MDYSFYVANYDQKMGQSTLESKIAALGNRYSLHYWNHVGKRHHILVVLSFCVAMLVLQYLFVKINEMHKAQRFMWLFQLFSISFMIGTIC